MTTAARPTFAPARGGKGKGEGGDLSALSKQYSSRDLPAHTKLKYRQEGQDTSDELRGRDFRRDLEERERTVREKRDRNRDSGSKRPRLEQIPAANLDADDPLDDEDDEDDSSDDEDDTAELLAELNKIKKERAREKAKLGEETLPDKQNDGDETKLDKQDESDEQAEPDEMVATAQISNRDEKEPHLLNTASHSSTQNLTEMNTLMDKLKSGKTILIGDSSLCDINTEELASANVHKHVKEWATIQHMKDELSIYNLDSFGNIVVSVGRIDILQGTDPELFEETYERLLIYIKARNYKCNVYICKIDIEDDNSNNINECIERLGDCWSNHDVMCVDNLNESLNGADMVNSDQRQKQSSQKAKRDSKPSNRSDGVCYSCRKRGHFIADCPERQDFQYLGEETVPSDRLCNQSRNTGQLDKIEDDFSGTRGNNIAPSCAIQCDEAGRDHSDRLCYHCRKTGHLIADCPIKSGFQFDSGEINKTQEPVTDSSVEYQHNLANYEEPHNLHFMGASSISDNKFSHVEEKMNGTERRKKQKRKCFSCRQPGHNIADCPDLETIRLNVSTRTKIDNRNSCVGNDKERHNIKKRVCYNCRQPGHNIVDCPYQEKYLR